jgi:hypothetical protein
LFGKLERINGILSVKNNILLNYLMFLWMVRSLGLAIVMLRARAKEKRKLGRNNWRE